MVCIVWLGSFVGANAASAAITTATVIKIAKKIAIEEITKRELFAHILANGTVDLSKSRGIVQANVTIPYNGFYCFSGLSGIKGGQVTPDHNTTISDNEFAQFGQFGFGDLDGICPVGTKFFVLRIWPSNRRSRSSCYCYWLLPTFVPLISVSDIATISWSI